MKILFGTGNQAKLSRMKERWKQMDFDMDLIGLTDLEKEGKEIPEAAETGKTPLENARQKALAYYKAFQMPVFSCDSGLYFENVPEELQPGVHVRTVKGVYLSDEEMMQYYAGLAEKYGDLKAHYQNAICVVLDENHIFEAMDASMASETFFLTSRPHSAIKEKGLPLDCISINQKTGKYYYDMDDREWERISVEDEFLKFLQKIMQSA